MCSLTRTIKDFIPLLRAGECPHALGDSSWCSGCQTELAALLERVIALMEQRAAIASEIERLKMTRPLMLLRGDP